MNLFVACVLWHIDLIRSTLFIRLITTHVYGDFSTKLD